MSHDPDENGLAPDGAPFVRPYVASSGPPPREAASPWPQSGPYAFPGPTAPAGGPAPDPDDFPVRGSVPAVAGGRRAGRRGRRSRLPLAVGTGLGLAAVSAFLLLSGPDQRPPRAQAPADLTVPALPAGGGPDTTAESPGPASSARSAAPSAPTAEASARATGPAKPSTAPTASTARPTSAYVTLRMGDSGPEVRALQEMLYAQGFTYVSVTGVYDGQTKRGVGQLQRDRSIKGDPQGVYGPNTQAAMG
ncbi:peptidoglycan-binding domain-containing protein [Streptomyces sp. NRRL F-2664]|uniref:peptidoglycan-binding domain-containing protein n=1 Tax=Streptomyces sp. NRRL F-2664 TaxID=1463842 RepID=UPI0004CA17BE|nr:peptidoglycan-binding domain-containing protein [Streptomyces sp. NRRL F-2664]